MGSNCASFLFGATETRERNKNILLALLLTAIFIFTRKMLSPGVGKLKVSRSSSAYHTRANSHSSRGRQRPLADSLPSAQLSPVVLKPSALTLMSHTHSAAASFSNFQLIINNALDTYRKRTKMDPLTHPLATQFEACDTPAAMLDILQKQVQGPNQSQRGNERW